jgi:hypothetical protein
MALLKKERILPAFWLEKEGFTLRDNLEGVEIEAHALSSEKGYTVLKYQFQNFQECIKELNATEDDAL